MIKHVVFFKLVDNSEANKEDIKRRFMSMEGKIEGMQNLEVGINFSTEDRAFDLVLFCDFDTKEGLRFYATHPIHVAIVNYLKSIETLIKVVDYEF